MGAKSTTLLRYCCLAAVRYCAWMQLWTTK